MADPGVYTELKVARHDPCGNPVETWTDQDGATQEIHLGSCLTAEGEIKVAPETVRTAAKATTEPPSAEPPKPSQQPGHQESAHESHGRARR